jgi:hypothetical protein
VTLIARRLSRLVLALTPLLLAAASAAGSEGGRWLGLDDRPLPFTTGDEVMAFLRTAEVVSEKELTGGTTRPLKVRLRQDGVEANAVFRRVDVRHPRAKVDGKVVLDFHDSYRYECAAWEVSRLLGIDNVPPCVERRYKLTDGTMELWIEDAMTEIQRRERGIEPPSQLGWIRQKQTMRLFDALIYNFDRNQGNMLIDSRWKLWFIDHTRSFRNSAAIENPEKIVWCERGVFERLQALDKRTLSKRLKSVGGQQVTVLLKRRDKLVRHLRSLIEQTGESAVIWDAAKPDAGSELPRSLVEEDIPLTSSQVENL